MKDSIPEKTHQSLYKRIAEGLAWFVSATILSVLLAIQEPVANAIEAIIPYRLLLQVLVSVFLGLILVSWWLFLSSRKRVAIESDIEQHDKFRALQKRIKDQEQEIASISSIPDIDDTEKKIIGIIAKCNSGMCSRATIKKFTEISGTRLEYHIDRLTGSLGMAQLHIYADGRGSDVKLTPKGRAYAVTNNLV